MPKIFEFLDLSSISFPMSMSRYMCMCFMEERRSIFDLIMMNGELVNIHVREKKGAEPLPEKDKRIAEEFIRKYHLGQGDRYLTLEKRKLQVSEIA